jgi:hypothetical protein
MEDDGDVARSCNSDEQREKQTPVCIRIPCSDSETPTNARQAVALQC